jgi:hypothetical protein
MATDLGAMIHGLFKLHQLLSWCSFKWNGHTDPEENLKQKSIAYLINTIVLWSALLLNIWKVTASYLSQKTGCPESFFMILLWLLMQMQEKYIKIQYNYYFPHSWCSWFIIFCHINQETSMTIWKNYFFLPGKTKNYENIVRTACSLVMIQTVYLLNTSYTSCCTSFVVGMVFCIKQEILQPAEIKSKVVNTVQSINTELMDPNNN